MQDGATALYVASLNNHALVVSLLLADPRVEVNKAMTVSSGIDVGTRLG